MIFKINFYLFPMEEKLYVICQFASESIKTLVAGVTGLLRSHGNFHIL